MTASTGSTLKVGSDERVASSDLIAFAQKLSGQDASGELQEQRFRRFGEGVGSQVWAELEIIQIEGTGTSVRVSILRGRSKRGAKIAEYEEVRLQDVDRPQHGKQDEKPEKPSNVATKNAPRSADQTTADIRRQQIVEGACEVISQKGYAEASVREIAEAAGVSIPSLYQYVKSKEDILFLITKGCMQRLFEEFRETIGAALSADAKIEKAIGDYLSYISDNRRYINLVYRETRSLSRENRERIFEIERALMKEWEEIIRSGVHAGEFNKVDPVLASNILYFSCSIWSLRHWAINGFGEAKVRKALTQILLDGLRN